MTMQIHPPNLSSASLPFELIEGDRTTALLLVADHAKRALPPEFGDLGVPADQFERHIAYDIGVEAVTRALARILGVPAVMANYSRLLIDPNRGEDDPTLVRQLYDGTVIPGNYPLPVGERERRLELYHRPYHEAVGALVASVAASSGRAPLLVSIHSFTPVMKGHVRPWHVGVLWDLDDRVARPLIEALREEPGMVVGDNEPYDGALRGDTMYRHAIAEGFPHVLIEIRQDLIADREGGEEWAHRFAPIIDRINRRDDVHAVELFGSRTGPIIQSPREAA